jgi:hypothetical protein
MSQFELIPSNKLGDRVFTPDWATEDIVRHFQPKGRILEPFKGDGAFLRYMPDADWCEIDEGRDFFKWTERVDWIVTNPPYSLMRDCWLHAARVSDNVVFLVPIRNFFSSNSFLSAVSVYGGLREIRVYGTGTRLGFPMGNVIGAIHCQRGYLGDMRWTRYAPRIHTPESESARHD